MKRKEYLDRTFTIKERSPSAMGSKKPQMPPNGPKPESPPPPPPKKIPRGGIGQKSPKRKTQAQLRGEYQAWTGKADQCAMCWIPSERCAQFRFNPALEMAHIVSRGRAGRLGDCIENVLFLCSCCHGAHHADAYTYQGVSWPSLEMAHLLKVKFELHELNIDVLARVSGYIPRYLMHLTDITFPELIQTERMRWSK